MAILLRVTALITPELFEDEEFLAKIAEHNGMTVEEVKEIIADHKKKHEKFKEKYGNHMSKEPGSRIKYILENDDLLKEIAAKKGVTVDELRTWYESCPYLEKRQ